MPKDEHRVFAEVSDEEIKQIIPPEEVEGYLSDGELMTADEVQERGLNGTVFKVDEDGNLAVEEDAGGDFTYVHLGLGEGSGKFMRQLRDYEVLFAEYALRWTVMEDRKNAVSLDNSYLQSALANAEAQGQQKQKEIDAAKDEREALKAQRDAVVGHLTALEQRMAAVQKLEADLIKTIQALAADLAKMQLEVIERVNQRTREMARAGVP
jgi:hypothetical protein